MLKITNNIILHNSCVYTYIIILYLVCNCQVRWKDLRKFLKYIFSKPLMSYSATVAYYFLISFFPFVFLLTKFTAFFSISSDTVMNVLYYIFPEKTYDILYTSLHSITATTSPATYIFYIIFALWSSSMLINSIRNVFNEPDKSLSPTKRFIIRRSFSMLFTLILALLIVFSLTLVMYINIIVSLAARYMSMNYITSYVSLILSVAVGISDFMLLYKFIPSKPIKFKEAFPGAVFSTLFYGIASWGYSLYIGYIADYSRFYGTFDAIIIFVVWLYILSYILILGGYINKYLIKIKKEAAN